MESRVRLSNLSEEDKELAYDNIVKQHGEYQASKYLRKDLSVISSFNWRSSAQGIDYWSNIVDDICSGNYIVKEPVNLFEELHSLIKEINKNK